MKKALLFALIFSIMLLSIVPLFILPASADTQTGNCSAKGSNVTWTLDVETGVLTFSGTGEIKEYPTTQFGSPWYTFRDDINTIIFENGITAIPNNNFSDFKNLTNVVIPDTVKSIGIGAFKNCTSLLSIVIPDSVTHIGHEAFLSCTELKDVTMGSGIETIHTRAFYDCHALVYNEYGDAQYLGNSNNPYAVLMRAKSKTITTCTIHESTRVLYAGAFGGCNNIKTVHIPQNVQSIGHGAFSSCDALKSVVMSDSVTVLDDRAFQHCTRLESVKFSNNLKTIGTSAFNGCLNLADITIPNTVTDIGSMAFCSCESLRTVVIPDSVRSLGSHAFRECKGLESITIGNGVTSLNDALFFCTNLTDISIGSSVMFVSRNMFTDMQKAMELENGIFYVDNWVVDCEETVTNAVIRDGTVGIAADAFQNADNIVSLSIPDSIRAVCDDALGHSLPNVPYNEYDNALYYGNEANPYLVLMHKKSSDITSCEIHPNTRVLYRSAFSCARSLRSITIPEGVTSIGGNAFWLCENLTSITIPQSVVWIENNAFDGCSNLSNAIYLGTPTQWGNVKVSWSNECLTNNLQIVGIDSPPPIDAPSLNLPASDKESGCGSVISGGFDMIALITLAGGMLVSKKKK